MAGETPPADLTTGVLRHLKIALWIGAVLSILVGVVVLALLGVPSIVAGRVFIFVPLTSLAVLTVFAAWMFIVLGVFQAVSALALGRGSETSATTPV